MDSILKIDYIQGFSDITYYSFYYHFDFRVEKGFSFRLALLLGLSSIIRSNGLISLGFIGYKCMRIIGKGKFIVDINKNASNIT